MVCHICILLCLFQPINLKRGRVREGLCKGRTILEAVTPSLLDRPSRSTLGWARRVHCHRKLGPPANAAGPGTRDSKEDVAAVDLHAPPMHLMHRTRRMRCTRNVVRRGTMARTSRLHVQSPDKEAARISVHACAHRGSGVQSDGCYRCPWWRAAVVAGAAWERHGSGLVGQVAPIEVGPRIVVCMHLRPRVPTGQGWGGRKQAATQVLTPQHCSALLRRDGGAPAHAQACC